VSAVVEAPAGLERRVLGVEEFGELVPISRFGGQGRVYRPSVVPAGLGSGPVVVKLYRRSPPAGADRVLVEMVAWSHLLDADLRRALDRTAAWPLAVVRHGSIAAGIVMRDVSGRFSAPFVMPSGRREPVLLTLEHLLGSDSFLQTRGLGVRLDTFTRAEVAERICDALAFLHRHAIVASDIAPNNLLVAFGVGDEPEVCFIDCDSMVFHGRQALVSVQTGDWDIPPAFGEPPSTRAADAYKLGLVILRLFARSHDARAAGPFMQHVPAELRGLLARALAPDAVNRPPAGEWQRALRGLLAEGRLNERYPGPVPARMVVRAAPGVAPAAPGVVRAAPGVVRAAPAVAGAAPAVGAALPAAHSVAVPAARSAAAPARAVGPRPIVPTAWSGSQVSGAAWLRRAVAVAWVVAGAAVLVLLLSRLFAAAIPTVPSDGGAGVGSQLGPGVTSPYDYQYYPRSRAVPGFVP